MIDLFKKEETKPTKKPDEFTLKLPNVMNLLLCYDELSEMNIYAFCVRAINCDVNSLFVIVRPEELKINHAQFILKIMKDLKSKMTVI